VDLVAVVITIAAPVMLTSLAVIVLKKDAHRGVAAKNALDGESVIAALDPVNVQMDIPVPLVNASTAQMTVVAKVHAIQRPVCATVLVDTLATIAVHVYAQKGMIH
jgi:hypothetical protein